MPDFILKQTVYGPDEPQLKGSVIKLNEDESKSEFWRGLIQPIPARGSKAEGGDADAVLARAHADAEQIVADAKAQAAVILKEAEDAKAKLEAATPTATSGKSAKAGAAS